MMKELETKLADVNATYQEAQAAEQAARERVKQAHNDVLLAEQALQQAHDARVAVEIEIRNEKNAQLVREANILAETYPLSYPELHSRVEKAVGGKYAASWAKLILSSLQNRQLEQGLSRHNVLCHANPANGRFLTKSQKARVWHTLRANCPWREETGDDGNIRLGTPYECHIDVDGTVKPVVAEVSA